MSKWTEIRDGITSALDAKDVVESAKNQMITSLAGDGMDALETVANKFIVQVQAQAADEQGWNAIRDKFVLPLLINGAIWAVKLTLAKSTTTQR
jgi:hypothetical protein